MLFSVPSILRSRVAAVVVAALWLFFALRFPVARTGVDKYVVLFVLAFLAQALPIVHTRQRCITFTASVVFAAALIVGPWAAGMIALLVQVVQTVLSRVSSLRASPLPFLVYPFAALCVGAVCALLSIDVPVRGLSWMELPGLVLAAALYLLGVIVLSLGRFGWKRGVGLRAQWGDLWAGVSSEVIAFAIGLPFVGLLVALRPDNFAVGGLAFSLSMAAFVWAVGAQRELRALRKHVRAVEALGQQAIDAQNLDSLLVDLLAAAHDLIPFDGAFVWIRDANSDCFALHATRPRGVSIPVPGYIQLGEGLLGRVAQRRRGIIGGDDTNGERNEDKGLETLLGPDAPMASILIVPLVAAERTVGMALFAHRDSGRYAPRDLQSLQSLASLVANALENVRLHQSLREMAVTDGLTGLTNHRRLQEILREELERSGRYGRPVSVILCDVDNFKQYNDTYGHPQGDDLLQRMARVLLANVRMVDTVARYGGEEFCIVLPETDRVQARYMADRLRAAVAGTAFQGKNSAHIINKTMSFGVASFPLDTRNPGQLVGLADEALYRAKHAGKNQVQVAGAKPTASRTTAKPARSSRVSRF